MVQLGAAHGSTLVLPSFIPSLRLAVREPTIQDANFLLAKANMRRHERDRVYIPCSRSREAHGYTFFPRLIVLDLVNTFPEYGGKCY